jgi:pimeloyl-[acyl-carrier protein] methyl ester esterase
VTGLPDFLFVHGWSFDAGFWDGVRALLPDADTRVAELGYTGRAPSWPPVSPGTVAVGHSAGLMRLLSGRKTETGTWRGLVSVNGFARFGGGDDFPEGIPPRILDRMLLQLRREPSRVLADFRQRCGADAPAAVPDEAGRARLEDGLRRLRDDDARPAWRTVPVSRLSLEGGHDPVVPQVLAKAALPDLPDAARRVHPDAGHLLPLSHPAWVAEQLRAFAAELREAGA